MPKNIVICCDGTNNEFGKTNTNVVRLYQCVDKATAANQVCFYNAGIGTIAPPDVRSRFKNWAYRTWAGAVGYGIFANVEEVIRFLMAHYETGDRVYMFGFSRGAYVARMAAGLLRKCNLPTEGNEGLWPYVRRMYERREYEQGRESQVTVDFRETFGRPCPIHFLGLWDTVSSVGIVWNPKSFDYTFNNNNVAFVRHAIAVDEQRGFFRTNRWDANVPNVTQVWFPGVHSDIGGGYPEGELWKHPFAWMVTEAQIQGLVCDQNKINQLLGANAATWHASQQHESMHLGWKLLSAIPKQYSVQQNGQWRKKWRSSRPRVRTIYRGEFLHRSVIERWRDVADYRPANLDLGIMQRLVGQLTDAATTYPYV